MRWIWSVVGLVSLTVGCVSTEFHPRYAAQKPQVTDAAVRFYEGDIATLRGAGAEVIGTVSARGSTIISYDTLARRAADEAAEQGGTHFILTDKGVDRVVGPEKASTSCVHTYDGANCETTFHQATYDHPTSQFVILRVEPSHWGDLPGALRPQPMAAK